MVYDLGGGTFDVSIIEMGDGVTGGAGHRGQQPPGRRRFRPAASSTGWSPNSKKRHGVDLRSDKMAVQRAARGGGKGENRAFRHATSTAINLPFITADATGPKHLDMTLTRAKFNELTADLVEATMGPVQPGA